MIFKHFLWGLRRESCPKPQSTLANEASLKNYEAILSKNQKGPLRTFVHSSRSSNFHPAHLHLPTNLA